MRTRCVQRTPLCGVIFLALVLVSCTGQVTLHGQAVTDPFGKQAAYTLKNADRLVAASARVLRVGHQQGVVPLPVLIHHTKNTHPAAVAALHAGRDALTAYLETKDATALEKLDRALEEVVRYTGMILQLLETYGEK